jgi:biotin carboxyl carrier protein
MNDMKDIIAPLSGKIIEIRVKPGDMVKVDQVVVILEAMKMDNELMAEYAGVVTSVNITEGDFVSFGTSLVSIE